MTRLRRRYRSLASLQRDNRACRACAEAGFPLASLPVFEGGERQRAYILGQAPGALEGVEGRPWRGRAGRTLRRWLDLDEDAFYATFYCASVTRCDPGRSPTGRGDRTPTAAEQELCSFWRRHELALLRPRLVLAVGGMAIRHLLRERTLACVGTRFEAEGAVVVPLPHPSGASGWLNAPENRARLDAALRLVAAELRTIARG